MKLLELTDPQTYLKRAKRKGTLTAARPKQPTANPRGSRPLAACDGGTMTPNPTWAGGDHARNGTS